MSTKLLAVYQQWPREIRVFVGVALVLLVGALSIEVVCRWGFHMLFPYKTPLLFEFFPDIVNLRGRFTHFGTLEFFTEQKDPPCMYPAPILVLYRFFYLFIPHDLGVFLGFVLVSFLVATILLGRALIRRGMPVRATVALLIFSYVTAYPLWFELKQANMEICVWVVLALGSWCFFHGRGYSAAACFGIAGAMKIFPFLYLGLLLGRRQYKQFFFAFGVAVLVTLPALWIVYPNLAVSWRMTNESVGHFRQLVMLHRFPQSGFDHSLFALLKRVMQPLPAPKTLDRVLTGYMAAAALGGLVCYFGWIRKLPVINQVLCLCIASIVLPPTSFDYTLMHLYIPWGLLAMYAVTMARSGKQVAGLTASFVCFAILFVPETEFILRKYTFGGQIKAVTLICLFVIGLRYPFSSEDDISLELA